MSVPRWIIPATLVSLAAVAVACRAHDKQTPPSGASAASTREQQPVAAGASRPQTAEGCKVCRGEWGPHGVTPSDFCVCGTNDGGKRCTDGNDCQGLCIAAGEIPEQEVREAGPPARGFFVGRCSDHVSVFGCIRIIDRGARARGPVPLADPPPMMCVD